MKLFNPSTRIFAAVATTALLVTPIASADQNRRHHNDGYRDSGRHYNGDRSRRGSHNRHNRADRRHHRSQQRSYNRGYRHAQRQHSYPHRSYGHTTTHHNYSSGPQYYRPHYRTRHNVGGHYNYHQRTRYVRNYGHYGLYDPPHGYHWVHDDDRGDAILASVATGAIIGLVVGAIVYD
mgnify:CR=1 FL=1